MRAIIGNMLQYINGAALWALAIPPYAMGWIAGFVSKLSLLIWAAMVEGYETGKKL